MPAGEEAELGEWEAGFTDADGCFLDRRQAAKFIGVVGRLEAVSYFDGEPNPTLEGGHLESWMKPDRRGLERGRGR